MYEGDGPVLLTAEELDALPQFAVGLFMLPDSAVAEMFPDENLPGGLGIVGQKDGDEWFLADGDASSTAEDLAAAAAANGIELKVRVLWVPDV